MLAKINHSLQKFLTWINPSYTPKPKSYILARLLVPNILLVWVPLFAVLTFVFSPNDKAIGMGYMFVVFWPYFVISILFAAITLVTAIVYLIRKHSILEWQQYTVGFLLIIPSAVHLSLTVLPSLLSNLR